MPSPWHDAIVNLFSENPGFGPRILRDWLGADIPEDLNSWTEFPPFNDRPSADFDSDGVIVSGTIRDPVHGLIVEVQQGIEPGKPSSLARYAAALWLLLRCRVDVLVICPDEATAAFYSQPVSTSLPGYTCRPKALVPSQVPPLTDPKAVAEDPLSAAFAVMYHGHRPTVSEAFVAGLQRLPEERRAPYYETVYAMASAEAQALLEELMTTSKAWPVYSPLAKEHFGRGEAQGEAEAILLFLEARGLKTTAGQRAQITACRDRAQLDAWVRKAATVTDAADLFR